MTILCAVDWWLARQAVQQVEDRDTLELARSAARKHHVHLQTLLQALMGPRAATLTDTPAATPAATSAAAGTGATTPSSVSPTPTADSEEADEAGDDAEEAEDDDGTASSTGSKRKGEEINRNL